jgi:succinoglycan biosynthesis protein ExoL
MGILRERFSQDRRCVVPGNDDAPVRVIAFFGHDSTESTVIKRVTCFQANGSRVIGFMFRRDRGNARSPVWENIDLGTTADWQYASRLIKLFAAFCTVVKHREVLRQCHIFYARNIDMLFVAALAKTLMPKKTVLTYEVLDVQTVFVGRRLINSVFRWMERVLLARCDLLVVSSPEFMTRYFQPCQRYTGPWRLLENKISVQHAAIQEERLTHRPKPNPPWVIGWFGNVRCVRSLEMLGRIADTLGDRVLIYIRGVAPEVHLPTRLLEAATACRRNLVFGGPYVSPHDLPTIYGKVHFAWCVDYLDAGTNSDWLLPNRLYEGGLMGAVAIARKDTATGGMVEREGLGRTFAEPLADEIVAFLDGLTLDAYHRERQAVEAKERSLFVDVTDTQDLLEHLDKCRQGYK